MSIAYPTTGNTVRDGTMEIHLDSVTGVLRIHETTTGATVYAEPDAEIMEAVVNLITAIRNGDQNYDAMEYLNPWENLPEGWEPYSMPGEPVESSKMMGAQTGMTSGQSGVQIRRSGTTTALYRGAFGLPTVALMGDGPGEWSANCPIWATQIGEMRLDYLQRRQSAVYALGGLLNVPGTDLDWRDGVPYVTLQSLRTVYATAAVEFVGAVQKSWALNFMRGQYNAFNCQQPIVLQTPTPGQVFTPPSGSGGSGMSCDTFYLQYEISFDGGMTWYPFSVAQLMCIENEE